MRVRAFRANPGWAESAHSDLLLALSDELLADWFALHDAPPPILNHYTTVEGLLGILESQRLWATHSAYLDDPSEIIHAHSLIQQAVEDRFTQEERPVAKELLLRARYAINPRDGMYQYFVISFCEGADLLGQWRAYSSRGGGYAVGFETRVMKELADPSPALTLRRVIYDHDRQRALIFNTIDRAVEELTKLVPPDADLQKASRTIALFVMFLRDHFSEFHFSFKNLAFEEEREWRLIIQTDFTARDAVLRDLHFRAAGGIAVPYLSIGLHAADGAAKGRLPIATLSYGPTIDSGRAEHSLRTLLDKYGYGHASVKSSQVPLRS